jgi:hypothetical protein
MRKVTVVVVAAMILLAGCSGGGGGAASPTEDSGTDAPATGTPTDGSSMEATPTDGSSMEATPTPDDDSSDTDSQSGGGGTLVSAVSDDPFGDATVTDGTWYNGTEQSSALIRNDTDAGRELIELTRPSGTTSLYTTDDYVAVRNGTTGEVQYGGPDSFIGAGVAFEAGFTAYGVVFYIGAVEWEQTTTTTVDGEAADVYESDSLNETALNSNRNLNLGFEQSDVQSVDGRIVIGSDGKIQSANVQIETADGTYGGDLSLEYDDITVTKPSWVDESQAP